MPAPKPVLKIAYKNTSGEAVPPHAAVQFDSDVEDIDSGISVNIVKPTSDGEHFALDEGKGAASEEEGGNYGQCIKALNGVFWAYYVAEDPPEEAWVTEVGPVDGEWYVDDTGSGFVYAGLHEPDNERILVMQLAGGGGGAVEGRLLSAITPASNSLSGATTFTFAKFVKDSEIETPTTPATLKEELISGSTTTPNPTTGVNRSTQLSAGVDGYVVCVRVNGEWRPIWVEDACAN